MVLNGDGPLLDEPTINGAYALHKSEGNAITLISALVEDTNGIGHIKRSADGKLQCIVEHKDATEEEKKDQREQRRVLLVYGRQAAVRPGSDYQSKRPE